MKNKILSFFYSKILKPVLFKFDAESVHNVFSNIGEILGSNPVTLKIISIIYGSKSNPVTINGVNFKNRIGLSAGFDYNGKMVKIMQSVGFGFNTAGTVTFSPYDGNTKPRLTRLPISKSMLVNKGFKSQGVLQVVRRLNKKSLKNVTFGVSVGSSNIPSINTIDLAVQDYINCFKVLEKSPYIKYYELNISCPNTNMTENFTSILNFEKLLVAVTNIKLKRPVFVKMPNELSLEKTDLLVKKAMDYKINSFIFSNLVKDRSNKYFDKSEIVNIKNKKGNFSGKPCFENALTLVSYFRKKYGNNIVIIGCGGVMSKNDAKLMFDSGADLIQLITGMIYQGPQLINELASL